jgi:hypothetical protein
MKKRYLTTAVVCLLWAFASMAVQSCQDTTPDPVEDPGGPGDDDDDDDDDDTPAGISADSISNHLKLVNAVKKSGSIPIGPSTSNVLMSFKDTLYLTDELYRPIVFRHSPSEDVAGVFLQISVSTGKSTYYYEVPELENTVKNDTASVVLVGFDSKDFQTATDFMITIAPYNPQGVIIGYTTRPGHLEMVKTAECDLELAPGEYWDWVLSYVISNQPDKLFDFYNEAGLVFNASGSEINGSCCYGVTVYPEFCPGVDPPKHNASLHFATYYRIISEKLWFHASGLFERETEEDSPVPLPAESDFCAGGFGKVKASYKYTSYEGDWWIDAYTPRPNHPLLLANDKCQLNMRGTSSSGTGYGNPGGVIHALDHRGGSMVLVQLDREGTRHLYKHYIRSRPGDPKVFPLN